MTQTVPDISPLMPMHQDPLLVLPILATNQFAYTRLTSWPYTLGPSITGSSGSCNIKHAGPDITTALASWYTLSYAKTYMYHASSHPGEAWIMQRHEDLYFSVSAAKARLTERPVRSSIWYENFSLNIWRWAGEFPSEMAHDPDFWCIPCA